MIRKIFIIMTAAVLTASLFACVFGKDERTFTYTAELNGRIRTLHAYNADGSIQRSLGVGIEELESEGEWFGEEPGSLTLWPFIFLTEAAESLFFYDDAFARSMFFARVTRDSTYMVRIDQGILLPHFVVETSHRGFPCSFSRARAFQIATGGTDTIAIKVSGKHLDRADTVRVAFLIDTAASRATDARVNFAMSVTGRVDVTCPEP